MVGKEFGSDKGRSVMIVRALYGRKSLGARFRDSLVSTLRDMGFKRCLTDPDVHMRKATTPNANKIWKCVLCYVDDVLIVSHKPQ